MRDIVKAFRRPLPVRLRDRNGGFPRLSARGRTASRMATDVPHRCATRSLPKALGNRLYGSLSTLLGITVEVRRQMIAEVARVVAGTVYQSGLAAAQELDAHQVHAG